ncbi:ESX-2 secretion system protein eccB2 [Mycobacterium lentiflavum]|uniref:ESX-2 secretion system protein eccB2 n=1 Tax=Mycobacterium lentiflavum TaxID=141349 RepID=A0A0E4H5M9_MYCLN|nr:type VII secretion protein EccB [Mycobacterium lentiflavum]CQD24188.1 ESX-2 secretion system protein eccB2 [Mycobacterium lentiflavum]
MDDGQVIEDRGRRRGEIRSPLAPVTAVQVAAHNFLRRRDEAAITENEVDMVYDTGHRENAFLLLGAALVIIGCVAAVVLAWIRPVGRVDRSQIVADADSHAIYVLVDGVLHPAWNLVSAQLVIGRPLKPATVKPSVLAHYPTGPRVGIVDAPAALNVHGSEASRWAVCDTAPASSSDPTPTVTALSGTLTLGGRAAGLATDAAVLTEHAGSTYVVWGAHRSRIDLSNRGLALALGIDSGAVAPVRMSNALFDAIPATEALETPRIPQAGAAPRWDVGPGAVVGSVLKVDGLAGDADELYVLLADGVQRVEPFVASLVMSSSPGGQLAPMPVSPKALASIPVVNSLRVDYYPPRRLTLVDTRAFPVLCVAWSKGRGDREAVTTVVSGKGLPIALSDEGNLTRLVRDDRRPNSVEANQVWVEPGAANLASVTSAAPDATSRESLWWLSPQGVRYGIAPDALNALGLNPQSQAVQVPWPLLRVYAQGPVLSRAAALVTADTVTQPQVVAPLSPPQ